MRDLFVVPYDVKDNARRRKVADLLQDYGHRVQFSVFEVRLSPEELRNLLVRLKAALDEEVDSLRLYPLCSRCQGRVWTLGVRKEPPHADDVVVIF